jgi:hypothetical protein
VQGNSFHLAGGKPGLKVSWQVTGIHREVDSDTPSANSSPPERENRK